MPDYAKKGFLQYVSSGGTAITDQATNIAMSQNAEVEKLIKGSFDTIKDSGKDASAAQKETLEQASRAGQAQVDLNRANGNAIAQANTLGGSLQNAADMQNQITASARYSVEAVGESGKTAEAQATSTDQTTQSFVKLTDQTNKFAVQMEALVGKNLDVYSKILADTMDATFKTMTKAINEIDKLIDTVRGKNQGANAPETVDQRTQRETADSYRRSGMANPALVTDQGMDFGQLSGANEGVFSGPTSGFPVLMHGDEAVIKMDRLTAATKQPLPEEIKKQLGGIDFNQIMGDFKAPGPTDMAPTMDNLTDAIAKLAGSMGNNKNTGDPMAEVVKHLADMKETAVKQLDMHTSMAELLGEANNLSGSILNNSY
jgi:hypothetical protein